uniref:TadE/TadG family type IV pilus assembly protein n=1 Tax=Brevundimonas sp. TaxID=1871086 RepID=UPI00289A9E19
MRVCRAMMKGRRRPSREGAAAVEFALVGPILILLLIGIVVYGGWFLTAQTVQAVASEGARAAVGGL